MPAPTSATLTGPSSGQCAVASTSFTVTLDQPAGVGGVVVTVASTVGGDTIASSPFTIASGSTSHNFTVTPSSGGNRDISISTSPALTIVGSPITYMAKAPVIALGGPSSGDCSEATTLNVALFAPACVGGVVVTVSSTDGSDVITSSPFTIAAGGTSATFQLTPGTCGDRQISITTNPPAIAYSFSPKTFTSNCACPDDAGVVSRSQAWTLGAIACPEAFSVAVSVTPSTVQAKDLYCGTTTLNMTITE